MLLPAGHSLAVVTPFRVTKTVLLLLFKNAECFFHRTFPAISLLAQGTEYSIFSRSGFSQHFYSFPTLHLVCARAVCTVFLRKTKHPYTICSVWAFQVPRAQSIQPSATATTAIIADAITIPFYLTSSIVGLVSYCR
jgi:hypothetical protein